MDKIIVCDHATNTVPRQIPSGLVGTYVQGFALHEMGPTYADFNALEYTWVSGQKYERIGFFGRRKYLLYEGSDVPKAPTPWGPEGWFDATAPAFDRYRNWLAEWDGAEMRQELAMFDVVVTPPWRLGETELMRDFATSRSVHDAAVLNHALRARGVDTFSQKIYPYIFITRWSVFDRFMQFAMPLARQLEPHCKGEDSTNEAYKQRPMAYVLERAFSLWLEKSGLSFTVRPILNCWEM